MTVDALRIVVDPKCVVDTLKGEVTQQLSGAPAELVVDFSGVARIDSAAVRALDELAVEAQARSVRLVLEGVGTDVYKVLKLLKMTERFRFPVPVPNPAPPSGDAMPRG